MRARLLCLALVAAPALAAKQQHRKLVARRGRARGLSLAPRMCADGSWGYERAVFDCGLLQSNMQCQGGQNGVKGETLFELDTCTMTAGSGSRCDDDECNTFCETIVAAYAGAGSLGGDGCCFWHSGDSQNKCEYAVGKGTKSSASSAKYGSTCSQASPAQSCMNTCDCNGHGTTCDIDTGVCDTCADNTTGDQCEMCDSQNKYYGIHSNCQYCDASTTCSGHGTCSSMDGSCGCDAGYEGANCAEGISCLGAYDDSIPEHGTVSTSNGGDYPATATYSCIAGYELSGSETRTCTTSGGYAGSPPGCTGVPCQGITSFAGGSVSKTNGGSYPSTATYSCGNGQILEGSATRTCGANGSFAGLQPACVAPSTTEAMTTEEVDDTDTDGDGVSDLNEGSADQPPPDADNDSIPDYLESNIVDRDSDGLMNQHDPDDDNDSQPTRMETATFGSACTSASDCTAALGADGYPDTDVDGTPDYLDEDDDGDGIATINEIRRSW